MLAVAVLLIVALRFSNTHTIAARGTLGYLPFYGDRGIAASANELLWERFGYGPAAIEMVMEHPIDGVGIGVFHTVVHDFATLRGYTGEDAIPTDNAQNWFRHNIAELGIIGSIPAAVVVRCCSDTLMFSAAAWRQIGCRSACCAA